MKTSLIKYPLSDSGFPGGKYIIWEGDLAAGPSKSPPPCGTKRARCPPAEALRRVLTWKHRSGGASETVRKMESGCRGTRASSKTKKNTNWNEFESLKTDLLAKKNHRHSRSLWPLQRFGWNDNSHNLENVNVHMNALGVHHCTQRYPGHGPPRSNARSRRPAAARPPTAS